MPEAAEGVSLSALLASTRRRLAAAGLPDPGLEARLIVEHLTGTERIDALRDPDRLVGLHAVEAVEAAMSRRLAGEPVHRIIGYREFYGLRLELSPDTLEPRPDTEVLVDLALPRLRRLVQTQGTCSILDLGTGTGAIALALLAQVPQARATGVDIAPGAVAMALINARRLGLEGRFRATVSDWFENVSDSYDAILSNPPYIRTDEMGGLAGEVRDHDPVRALLGGDDGLDAYRSIAAGAASLLKPGGFVGVEIGSRQKTSVINVFDAAGFRLDHAAQDLAGHDRALVFRK